MASTNTDASFRYLNGPKVVWHDPRIKEDHNPQMVKDLRNKNYNVFPHFTVSDAIKEIIAIARANGEKCIVMTSATNGKDLIKQVNPLGNIIGVIVYCFRKSAGEKIKNKCIQQSRVCVGNQNLFDTLQEYSKQIVLRSVISIAPSRIPLDNASQLVGNASLVSMYQSRPNVAAEYYCFKPERAIDFSLVKLLFTESVNAKRVMEELISLDKFHSRDTQMIKKYFIGHMKPDFDLLKAFCMVYSSQLVFKKFNNCFAKGEYMRVIKSLIAVLRELKKVDNENKVYRPQDLNKYLFRGVEKRYVTLSDYTIGTQGFWPAFTSTSFKENVAQDFAENEGVIFKISLSRNKPHPNIIMKDMTVHRGEDEVLLVPFFALKVINVEKDVAIGAKRYTYIYVEQREEDSVLSLDPDEMWISRLEQQLWPSIEEEIDRVCDEFCSTLRIKEKMQSEEFRQAFCENIKELCLEHFPNHDLFRWNTVLSESAIKKPVQDAISQAFNQRKSKLIADMLQKEILECKGKNKEQDIQKIKNVEDLWEPKNSNAIQDLDAVNYVFGLWRDIPENDNDPVTKIRKLAALLETIAKLAPNDQLSEIYNDPNTPVSMKAAYLFYQYININDEKLEEALWKDFSKGVMESCNIIDNCSRNLIGECKESFLTLKKKIKDTLGEALRRPAH